MGLLFSTVTTINTTADYLVVFAHGCWGIWRGGVVTSVCLFLLRL